MVNSANRHAIVNGASLAGLLTARVLAEHFEHVTIIERDTLPDGPDPRNGVPQAVHAHGLLAQGLRIISDLFPDLPGEMVAGGAIEDDIAVLAWHQFGVWKKHITTGIRGMFFSRAFLDWHLRKRVAAIPNVTIRDRHHMLGFALEAGTRRMRGVHVLAPDGMRTSLPADLVIDASGRCSSSPRNLEELGFRRPPETEIKVAVGYATRTYRRAGWPGWKAMLVTPTAPAGRRMGVLFPLEGDRWIVTLAGWLGDHPPVDEAGFLEYARQLPVPHIHDHLRASEPLSPIGVHRFASSLRRHYEQIRQPEGFAVLGDAVASFNPVYGQGMTTASLSVMELSACLAAQRDRNAPARAMTDELQRRVSRVVDRAWMVSAGEDFRYPEVPGERPAGTALINAYMAHVHRLAATDEKVLTAFYRTSHMLDRPEALFHPAIAWRVLASLIWPAAPEPAPAPAIQAR